MASGDVVRLALHFTVRNGKAELLGAEVGAESLTAVQVLSLLADPNEMDARAVISGMTWRSRQLSDTATMIALARLRQGETDATD